MAAIDDDLKLVIINHHNHQASLSLEYSAYQTYNQFYNITNSISFHDIEIILKQQAIIRKRSVYKSSYLTVLNFLIKLTRNRSNVDFEKVDRFITILDDKFKFNFHSSNIRNDLNIHKVQEQLSYEGQLRILKDRINSYGKKNCYFLNEINLQLNDEELVTISVLSNLYNDFFKPLIITSKSNTHFNYYPSGLINPYHLHLYLLELNHQCQMNNQHILIILNNNNSIQFNYSNISLQYINLEFDRYFSNNDDFIKFPNDYGLSDVIKSRLLKDTNIIHLIQNYSHIVNDIQSDPIMTQFSELCIDRFFCQIENTTYSPKKMPSLVSYKDDKFILNNNFIPSIYLDYNYSVKDVYKILESLKKFQTKSARSSKMDLSNFNNYVTDLLPKLDSDLQFKLSILYNQINDKYGKIMPIATTTNFSSKEFKIPELEVNSFKELYQLQNSIIGEGEDSDYDSDSVIRAPNHLVSTLYVDNDLVNDTSITTRKRIKKSNGLPMIKRSKILQSLKKDHLSFIESEDETLSQRQTNNDKSINDTFVNSIQQRSKYNSANTSKNDTNTSMQDLETSTPRLNKNENKNYNEAIFRKPKNRSRTVKKIVSYKDDYSTEDDDVISVDSDSDNLNDQDEPMTSKLHDHGQIEKNTTPSSVQPIISNIEANTEMAPEINKSRKTSTPTLQKVVDKIQAPVVESPKYHGKPQKQTKLNSSLHRAMVKNLNYFVSFDKSVKELMRLVAENRAADDQKTTFRRFMKYAELLSSTSHDKTEVKKNLIALKDPNSVKSKEIMKELELTNEPVKESVKMSGKNSPHLSPNNNHMENSSIKEVPITEFSIEEPSSREASHSQSLIVPKASTEGADSKLNKSNSPRPAVTNGEESNLKATDENLLPSHKELKIPKSENVEANIFTKHKTSSPMKSPYPEQIKQTALDTDKFIEKHNIKLNTEINNGHDKITIQKLKLTSLKDLKQPVTTIENRFEQKKELSPGKRNLFKKVNEFSSSDDEDSSDSSVENVKISVKKDEGIESKVESDSKSESESESDSSSDEESKGEADSSSSGQSSSSDED